MKSHGRFFSLVTVLSLAWSVLITVPTGAHAIDVKKPPPSLEKDSALAKAAELGKPVEVESARTSHSTVFANPKGTFTAEIHSLPVRVQQENGWEKVDTSLQKTGANRIAPRISPVVTDFSSGGEELLAKATYADKTLELSWPSALPDGAVGDYTITYPEIMPGIDLKVRASVTGFSQLFVVKTREAATSQAFAQLTYGIKASGVAPSTDEHGNFSAKDESGNAAFVMGAPLMWDSSGSEMEKSGSSPWEMPSGAKTAQAHFALTADGNALGLTPNAEFLASKETALPLHLAPVTGTGPSGWTSVWGKYPNSTNFNANDIARVGYEAQEGNTNRSYFNFDVSSMAGKQIVNATLQAYETWSWSCNARPVELWRTDEVGSWTSWNNQPAWRGYVTTVWVAKGYPGCSEGGVDFWATPAVADAAAEGLGRIGLMLKAENEGDTLGWKKFRNNPYLSIEYNSRPNPPANIRTDPESSCSNDPDDPSFLTTTTPILKADISDPDAWAGQHVHAGFDWWVSGASSAIRYVETEWAPSGNTHQTRIPAGDLREGVTYGWRVIAGDQLIPSEWSGFCYFRVDTAAPSVPPIVTSPDFPENGDGYVGRPSQFTFGANGVADVHEYLHGMNQDPPTESVWPDEIGGEVTTRITVPLEGPNTLFVRSVDGAGNLGPIKAYKFNAFPAPPLAHWTFDESAGSVAGDTTGVHPLTLNGNPTWEPSGGRIGGDLRFNASGQRCTSGQPVVGKVLNMSVSTWIRVDQLGQFMTVFSQRGAPDSSFVHVALRVDPFGRVQFTASTADLFMPWESYTQLTITSQSSIQTGQWLHIAAVMDGVSRTSFLYINGQRVSTSRSGNDSSALAPQPIVFADRYTSAAWREPFRGSIDETQIFDYAITESHVTDLAAGQQHAVRQL